MPVSTLTLRIKIYDAMRVDLPPADCDALRRAVEAALNLPRDEVRDALLYAANRIVAPVGLNLAYGCNNEGQIIGVQLQRGRSVLAIA